MENNENSIMDFNKQSKFDYSEILLDDNILDLDDLEPNESIILVSAFIDSESNNYIFVRTKLCDNISKAFIKSSIFNAGRKGHNFKLLQDISLDDVGNTYIYDGENLVKSENHSCIKKAKDLVSIVAMYKDGNADGQELTYDYNCALNVILHNAYIVVSKSIERYMDKANQTYFSREELSRDLEELRISEFLDKYSFKIDIVKNSISKDNNIVKSETAMPTN